MHFGSHHRELDELVVSSRMGGTPFELSGVIARDDAIQLATQRVMRRGQSRLGYEQSLCRLSANQV